MRKVTQFSTLMLSIMLISSCSSKTEQGFDGKSYSEMTETEQEAYLDKYVDALNNPDPSLGDVSMQGIVYSGSVKDGMIFATLTYPKKIPANKIQETKVTLSKAFGSKSDCEDHSVVAMNQFGLGFQTIVKDVSGNVIFKKAACPAIN